MERFGDYCIDLSDISWCHRGWEKVDIVMKGGNLNLSLVGSDAEAFWSRVVRGGYCDGCGSFSPSLES